MIHPPRLEPGGPGASSICCAAIESVFARWIGSTERRTITENSITVKHHPRPARGARGATREAMRLTLVDLDRGLPPHTLAPVPGTGLLTPLRRVGLGIDRHYARRCRRGRLGRAALAFELGQLGILLGNARFQ